MIQLTVEDAAQVDRGLELGRHTAMPVLVFDDRAFDDWFGFWLGVERIHILRPI